MKAFMLEWLFITILGYIITTLSILFGTVFAGIFWWDLEIIRLVDNIPPYFMRGIFITWAVIGFILSFLRNRE